MNAVRIAYGLHLLYGLPVISNVPITFGRLITTADEILHARNHICIWDEMQDSLDSRAFQRNIEATQQAIYTGKRGNILIYTSPDFSMFDKRYRILTRYLYYCEKPIPGRSIITRAVFRGGAEAAIAGRFMIKHKEWGPLYDTLYEDVRLLPATERLSGASTADRRRSDAGNQQRAAVLRSEAAHTAAPGGGRGGSRLDSVEF